MQDVPHGLTEGIVTQRVDWTDNMFTIQVQASIESYVAGQFTKLGLKIDNEDWVRRAYSMVNSPNQPQGPDYLEFLIISDSEGQLSPKLFELQVGDSVYVDKRPSGFMIMSEIPEYAKELWFLSTGTAVGPFLAMLEDKEEFDKYEKVVLVHAVRASQELIYQDKIAKVHHDLGGKFMYVPVVSREDNPQALRGRIPKLLLNGELLQATNLDLDSSKSFFYLCGNPAMVKDTSEALKKLGFEKHLRRKPGHFSYENYW
ncbi:Ferredoxin--NADP reductase [Vibrio nigripulchritudo SFn27]|uniref:ferredoxin--NADP(+) reductase n=1 Tax=Vibrio nigripulchritudo TaxID=28173 RepID=U4KBN6_9VIBR|nr:ferredoxin--NADP reductase [Vibrio nigripulchritudo]CCN36408.1 Ferredoxin--NADP reductase [Vibrio nigripulchritudo AM115]CCN40699.1 Ferredoxin--NADP reductase [Vibrio nigripulchritudo FTn2]CCN64494.1 Ferredoxin--NADP reductase [Vibrio nigripulchritudo POn4]CCN77399.1 Ferredoxin--NADP reductase [Vibrio nigripulchritudo SO65]CCN82405.1 Ferredoxin--NADP reductase [Vibrio nigripulchritudo BLFn1]